MRKPLQSPSGKDGRLTRQPLIRWLHRLIICGNVLAQAGVPGADKLRGPAFRDVALVEARDGYAVAFTLAEFDPALGGHHIVLADHEDGAVLPTNAGPLRLIVPGDQKGARWVRMVNRIQVGPAKAR